MKPQHKVAKPGKLKFKSTFQDKIDRHTERMLEQKEKEHEAKQYDELFREKLEARETKIEFPVTTGTGRIATSGKSVHGVDTSFRSELQKGSEVLTQEIS